MDSPYRHEGRAGKIGVLSVQLPWIALLQVAVLVGIGRASAQTSPAAGMPEGDRKPETVFLHTKPSREGLLHLDISVSDDAGRPVTGLGRSDLTLLDNGTPTKTESFHAAGDPEDANHQLSEAAILIDEIDLSGLQLTSARDEVVRYLRRDEGKLTQPTSVYWLSNSGLRGSPHPTTDGNNLANDVEHHFAPRVVWNSIPQTRQELVADHEGWSKGVRSVYALALAWRHTRGRKALIWLGYGWPHSGYFAENDRQRAFSLLVELSTRIREARMVINQISPWFDPHFPTFDYTTYVPGVRADDKLQDAILHFTLPVLSLQSGGLVLEKRIGIGEGIEQCIRSAISFYTVSFDPPPATRPDEYHTIEVKSREAEWKARTTIGYYDQPVFYDQPRIPARRVTVAELEQLLGDEQEEHRRDLAKVLQKLQLTERLSSSRLAFWENRVHGKSTREALIGLADEAVFLGPPADEITNNAAPSAEMQRQILIQAAQYVAEVLPRLPDFFATRTTVEYEQAEEAALGQFADTRELERRATSWKSALADQTLREALSDQVTLLYRDEKEEQTSEKEKGSQRAREKALEFKGVFGPILSDVLGDAMSEESRIVWSRWQKTDEGTKAVFAYTTHMANPHYGLVHCCLVGPKVFTTKPPYHGELMIDPATGTILRLTMEGEPGWIVEPNLQPVLPVTGTSMMVEYGPVSIGGRQFICPQRSVVTIRSRTTRSLNFWDETFSIYGPYETQLNDITYARYHKFGSQARILPGFEVVPDAIAPSPDKGQQLPRH